ncbi:MAG: SDR family oxidoreductase [Actinobacteria bacterium]|nr:SDR family oxidoreductase [Actinomycetota bacterium]
MRVFVTGASGFIGSAVVPELIHSGHQVVGLARSEDAAAKVQAAGAGVLRGDLEDLAALRAGAADAEGVIHLAFIHDFTQYGHSVEVDQRAIEVLGDALEGSGRPLVIASGVATTAAGNRVATEQDEAAPAFPRSPAAQLTLGFADRGVRPSVVRLPPTVHGEGDKGFVATLIGIAREKGVSGYIGDGSNRWPAVHRYDAARLFRLAVEIAPAGAVLHAVADEGVATRSIAEVIGRHLDVPVRSIAPDAAGEHFGWLAPFFAIDVATSSTITQQLLDWHPIEPGLLDDLEKGHYFS